MTWKLPLLALVGTLALAGPASPQLIRSHDQKMYPANDSAYDYFGSDVDVHDDLAVFGAIGRDDRGPDTGVASLYKWDGSSWNLRKELYASDPETLSAFGISVAVRAPWVFVGASLDDHVGVDSGSVRVFHRSGGSWLETQILVGSNTAAGDQFGLDVDLDVNEDVLLVGAPEANSGKGLAYVFRYDGFAWVEEQMLQPTSYHSGGAFGTRLAVDAGVAVIGAPKAAADMGEATVFRHDGSQWIEEGLLESPSRNAGDDFSLAVEIEGDWIAIGSPDNSSPLRNAGSVFLFQHDGVDWQYRQELTAHDAGAEDRFGRALGLSAGRLITTAPGWDTDSTYSSNAGALYGFRFDGAQWNAAELCLDPGPNDEDQLAYRCAMHEHRAVAGAFLEQHGPDLATGAVFYYKLSSLAYDNSPNAALPGTPVRFECYGGVPSTLSLVYTSMVNDTRLSLQLFAKTMNAKGSWRKNLTIPNDPNLSGLLIIHNAIGFDGYGKIALSNASSLKIL